MRSFVLLVGTLSLMIFLVCFGLRWTALHRQYQPLHHPLAQIHRAVIAYQGGSAEAPANSWAAIDRIAENFPQVIVWLDLQQTKDEVFVLYGADYLDRYTDGEGLIRAKTYQELQALDAGFRFTGTGNDFPFRGQGLKIRRLDETLNKYPDLRFVLNDLSNTKETDKKLVEIVKNDKAENRVMINSPYDVILKSAKKQNPLLMYGAGSAELTLLLMFDAVGLAPLAPLKGDIVMTADPKISRGFSPSLIEEVHRRKKLIISGMVESREKHEQMNQMGFDGVITDAPYKLLRSSFD